MIHLLESQGNWEIYEESNSCINLNYHNMQNSFDASSFDATGFVPGRTSSPKMSPLSGIGKPRRSRASKKPPTTILTADTTNFRALVQQFTGCHSGPTTHKGPINLNFEQYNYSSEKTEARSAWGMNEESVSFRSNDVTTATTSKIISDGESFVSRSDHKSRPDPLTVDDFDLEDFSLQEMMMLGAGEDDDLWGF
ncbi:hypothetical protein ACS0TY_019443 [Phlomoides rotata]